MNIFSATAAIRIPIQQRSPTADLGSALDSGAQTTKSSATSLSVDTALQFDSSQKTFQASLASTALDSKTVRTTTMDGKYPVPAKDPTGQVTSVFVDLYGSDIDLIAKATGSTYVDGDFVGGDQQGAQDLTQALWDMRTSGTGAGAMANPIKGDITAADLQSYIDNRGKTIGNYQAIDTALGILSSPKTDDET